MMTQEQLEREASFCDIAVYRYSIDWNYTFTERYDRRAQIDNCARTISIASHIDTRPYTNSSKLQSFIHELLHAADNVSARGVFDGEGGEDKLDSIASLITQALLSNPAIPKLFVEEAARRAAAHQMQTRTSVVKSSIGAFGPNKAA